LPSSNCCQKFDRVIVSPDRPAEQTKVVIYEELPFGVTKKEAHESADADKRNPVDEDFATDEMETDVSDCAEEATDEEDFDVSDDAREAVVTETPCQTGLLPVETPMAWPEHPQAAGQGHRNHEERLCEVVPAPMHCPALVAPFFVYFEQAPPAAANAQMVVPAAWCNHVAMTHKVKRSVAEAETRAHARLAEINNPFCL